MWLFFVLIFLFLFFAVVLPQKNYKSSKHYLFLTFAIIGILIMFRSVTVGNDTDVYTYLFKTIASTKDINLYIKNSRFESGYIYLNWFLSKISDNPQILFIVTGFFTALSFKRFIYQYSEMPWMSVLMYMTLQFYDLSLTGVRQIIAIAILLYSYDFIVKRKPIIFTILVLLATTIHTSAILFLILYPLASRKQTKKFYIISGSISVVVFASFSYVLTFMNRIFPQYIKYFLGDNSSYSASATLAVFLMLGLWVVIFAISRRIESKQSSLVGARNKTCPQLHKDSRMIITYPEASKNALEVSIWLGILMLFLALHGTILNRYKYVFTATILVYYPNALKKINNGNERLFMVAGSCIVFIIYILIIYIFRPEWQSTYPYSFCW